jgi:hypothetical protein
MSKFELYMARGQARYDNFDPRDLAAPFVPYYDSGQRIKVRFPWGEVRTGTVGVTGGWRPVFLLMGRKTDRGSSLILEDDVKIIAVHRTAGRYTEVSA